MPQPKAPNVRVHPLAHEDLKRLQAGLEADEGVKARHEDIVSALVHGVTVPQAAGMLSAFNRYAAAAAAGASRKGSTTKD